jgi:hypothetical protein
MTPSNCSDRPATDHARPVDGLTGLGVPLIGRRRMYAADAPLWNRYEQACDFLNDDIASGYVRMLQEMIATGWSDTKVAEQVLGLLQTWQTVLEEVVSGADDDRDGLAAVGQSRRSSDWFSSPGVRPAMWRLPR